jgi:hypothetical protein
MRVLKDMILMIPNLLEDGRCDRFSQRNFITKNEAAKLRR